MNSKKQTRVENKKRKAEVLEQLIQLNVSDKKKFNEHVIDSQINTDKENTNEENKTEKNDFRKSEEDIAKEVKNDPNDKEKMTVNSAEDLEKLRAHLRAEQKIQKCKPKLIPMFEKLSELAKGDIHYRFIKDSNQLPEMFIYDIQHLILFIIQSTLSSYRPRWSRLLRLGKVAKIVLMVLDGISLEDVVKYPDKFGYLTENFDISMEMISPVQYGSDVLQDIFLVPLSNTHFKLNGENLTNGMYENTLQQLYNGNCIMNYFQKADRIDYLLSAQQMMTENFPLPLFDDFKDFVFTHEKYEPVTNKSPMYAIDCEMCLTTASKHELVWIAVIDENLECIYNTLVKPKNPILDYMTRYSGVTKEALDNVFVEIEAVQKMIQEIIPNNSIICGHSLNMDLQALKMFHPYVIDTSCVYNIHGSRGKKPSLALLSKIFLRKEIQTSCDGHDPAEDASATMELVQEKLKNGMYFGDVINGGALHRKELAEIFPMLKEQKEKIVSCKNSKSSFGIPDSKVKESLFKIANKFGRRAGVIDTENNKVVEGLEAAEFKLADNDKDAISLFDEHISSWFLTCLTLRGDGHFQKSEEQKIKCLKRFNKSIKKVVNILPENTIVNVILSGRESSQNSSYAFHNGVNYFKIT